MMTIVSFNNYKSVLYYYYYYFYIVCCHALDVMCMDFHCIYIIIELYYFNQKLDQVTLHVIVTR